MIPALQKAHAERMERLARMGALPARPAIVITPAMAAPKRAPATPAPLRVVSCETLTTVIPAAFLNNKRKAREMIADIAEKHRVTFRDVIGVARFKEIVAARMEACFEIAKAFPSMSLSEIGRLVRKDHTTVIHAIRVFNERTGENLRGLGVVSRERREKLRASARRSHAVEVRA